MHTVRIALLGFGNVGRAFAALLESKRHAYPFRITGVHTRREGSAYPTPAAPVVFGPGAGTIEEFFERSRPDIVAELTTLDPFSGEPAVSHIRAAFEFGAHVVTANKGPIAHAYASLCEQARSAGVEFRFESTCMDGAPVFNMVRNNLPGVRVLGFTGALNSTTKVAVAAMQRGLSLQDGIAEAQQLGIAEADASYDIDGWDSAAKSAALANVLMNAKTDPSRVDRSGIGGLDPAMVQRLGSERKTVVLVSRARMDGEAVELKVGPEILPDTDILAAVRDTSNLLLLHTDLMGTVGTVSISPGVEQTAYGVFSDIVDIARTI